jgi:broad specificity phosphatase PhoE
MFAIKPPAYLRNNQHHYKKRRIHKRYDRYQHPNNDAQNYDLRLIVVRHAERVDTSFGEKWYDQVFGGVPSAPAQSYLNPILPQRLPRRSNTFLYVFDPPITRTGEQKSFFKGQQLAGMGASVDYCYSSPASRSVLTANAILQGMGRNQISMRLEPYLFEPMNWNTPFQMLGNISPFMSTGDWIQSGYNVDRRYRRLNDYLNPYETENDYYQRTQSFFQTIERRHGGVAPPIGHGHAYGRRSTVLIVGHAASPTIFPTIATRQQFNSEQFGQQCANVPFLHTIVLERHALTRIWSVRPIMSFA